MVTDSHELLGQALGTCTLQRLLGRGGMGVVYLAQQSRPRRAVAVKVLMPESVLEKKTRIEFLARFRREADAIAALDHIHIMPIYEYGERDELAYLVMPYVSGGTLREVLEERRILPLAEALSILEQAASALDCAHAQGIIHRDLKPGNMLFHADGRLLLADFGLAKVLKETREQDSGYYSVLTSIGTIIGTPEYLSPEQSMGKALDHRSDIYSLGVVLYQMLSGRVPFTGASPVAIAIKHSLEEPPPLCSLNPTIPQAVEAVVMRAMKKDPARRYNSAGEFAYALRQAIYESASAPTPAPPPAASPRLPQISSAEEPTRLRPAARVHEQVALALHAPSLPTPAGRQLPPHVVPTPYEPPQQVPEPDRGQVQPELRQRHPRATRSPSRLGKRFVLASIMALLAFGGVLSYFTLHQAGKHPDNHNKAVSIPHAGSTPIRRVNGTPLPPLVSVGTLLYSTSLPGPTCDPGGGTWSSTSNARVTCSENGTALLNSDASHLAGIFLDRLPHGTILPRNYIIQVQVSVNLQSQSEFGIFFRNQPGAQQGAYSFLLSSSGYWRASTYDNQSGNSSVLYGQQVTQAQLETTNTIDIVVQGNTFTFYLNHYRQGDAISNQYTRGAIGLAASAGSSVSFKNLSIYTLPGETP